MALSKPRLGLSALVAAGSIAGMLVANAARADIILDPLHGTCNGTQPAGACVDNGTNTPLGSNSTTFGFTISPGPQTGDLTIVALIPNNIAFNPSTITETIPNSHTYSFTGPIDTAWTSGDLATFLGIDASPNNPIGAYLPTTQNFFDPTATGFRVFTADVGTTFISANGGNSPTFSAIDGLAGPGNLPTGSYLVAFCAGSTPGGDCTVGSPNSLTEVATANSGALLVNGSTRVPEPASLALFGTALAGLGLIRRRRRKNV